MTKLEKAYLTGRIPEPAWLKTKRVTPYVYGASAYPITAAYMSISIDDDSYFLVDAVNIAVFNQGRGAANGFIYYFPAHFQIIDTTQGRAWSNGLLFFGDVSGFGAAPRLLKEPNIVFPGTVLQIKTDNTISTDYNMYAALFGRKVYGLTRGEAQFLNQRLSYQFAMGTQIGDSSYTTLASNATSSLTFAVQQDSDFLVKRLLGSYNYYNQIVNISNGGKGTQTDGAYGMDFNIKSQKAQKYLFQTPVSFESILGTYAQTAVGYDTSSGLFLANGANGMGDAFSLKKPFLVRRGDALELLTVNRFPTAQYYQVVLDGVRMFI